MKVLQFTLPVAPDTSVIVQEDRLPYFYPHLHRHNEAQLTWIQEGEGTLVAGTHMHSFKANDIFLVGANQPHLFKSSPEYFSPGNEKETRSVTIFFNPKGRLASFFQLPEMHVLHQFIQQHEGGFKLPAEYIQPVSQQILKIQRSRDAGRLMQFFELLVLFYSFNTRFEPLSPVALENISESEGIRIGTVYNYIMQHYDTMISLDEVAAEIHMTPQAFCRYFKKHTGHTFITFLNEMRVNEACKKLTAGKFDSISTVAYTCGFNSITNFNRVFKGVTGHSPREYLGHFLRNF